MEGGKRGQVQNALAPIADRLRYSTMSPARFAAAIGTEPTQVATETFYEAVHNALLALRASATSPPTVRTADEPRKIRVLVDGVFFQLAQTGIARLWASILPHLVNHEDLEIWFLDRGNSPDVVGMNLLPFHYRTGRFASAESLRIDAAAAEIGADVFVSTYYTTPTSIPSVLVVYDMIPEIHGFDLAGTLGQEKQLAISFARRHLCISHSTKTDLQAFHSHITDDQVTVGHCGLDRNIFRDRGQTAVQQFKDSHGLAKPYVLWVGSRGRRGGYKNGSLLFDTMKANPSADFDILCTGGEQKISRDLLQGLPESVGVQRLDLSDDELALAYSGALALVYPSLYEGFGMPVIEAMACGCPVITTRHGSLGEVAGDAAIFITGHDTTELVQALEFVQNRETRALLVTKGKARALHFSWKTMADSLGEALKSAAAENNTAAFRKFSDKWGELRKIQRAVDYNEVRRRFRRFARKSRK